MNGFARSIGLIPATIATAGAVIVAGIGCEGADIPPAPDVGDQGDYVPPEPIEVISFSPSRALPNDTITILGSGFRPDINQTRVFIGNAGATVTAATESTLTAVVPVFAGSGPITVADVWDIREGSTESELDIAVPETLGMGSSGDADAPIVGSDNGQSIVLETGATTYSLAGDVTGAGETGYWAILDIDGFVRSAGVLPQSGDRYAQTLAMFCGRQGLVLYFDNESGRGFHRGEVTRVDCEEPGIRVKLSWDTDDTDVDLHFIRPGGTYAAAPGDCYFGNSNPDWGVEGDPSDNPELDVDDVTGYGPENIYLQPGEDGDYRTVVHYWSDRGHGASNAWVEVFLDGGRVASFGPFELPNEGTQWQVCTITWPDGVVTPNY